ncbi:MAG: 50S ribosomal protein L10 [Candidatus Uhrbacteria bacterium]|nr:50S ribosomal protein L10 [Candidatus Uhrbacteria bacterium]
MPKTREQKTQEIERLTQAFKQGKSAVFTDYQGVTVAQVAGLRKQLRTAQVDYVVAKKTLLALAAKQAGYDINFKLFPGMMGVAFGLDDEMAPAKFVGDASKTTPIKLVGGIFEGKPVDQAYVITLSKLPSKSQLLGQLLNVMNGPMSAFARFLSAYKDTKIEAPAA